MKSHVFHLHTLSALHCGTGQSVGVVDLPIARARATQLPIVPGSSLRGVLRHDIQQENPELTSVLFGPKNSQDSAESFAGALAVGDAHLLVLPIRALSGIIAYATCPFILTRYTRDLEQAGLQQIPNIPQLSKTNTTAFVTSTSVNVLNDHTLVLEDLDLNALNDSTTSAWAEKIAHLIYPEESNARGRTDFINRFVILPDNIFSYLSETATEIRTRISIDQKTGTVKKGALWFEEHLPAESILWGIYAISASNAPKNNQSAEQLFHSLAQHNRLLQVGGQSGVGRGLVQLLLDVE